MLLNAAAFAAALAASTAADQVEYAAYYFKDNGNNTVATSSFSLAKTLFRRTVVLLDVELDQTTVPPLDAVTGASRPRRHIASNFEKNRGQIIGGVEQGLGDNTRVAGNYYFSQEVDYQSQAVIGSVTQDFFQKNLTVSLKGQYTYDLVGDINESGGLTNQMKETHQGSLMVTQLLSPTTILRVGGDGMRNHGLLSDPYRSIVLHDPADANKLDTVPEQHPSMRYRGAAWAEVSQYLRGLDASAIVNYRYYQDDWDVKSHTLALKLNKYVTPNWILSPEYRYYTQSEADWGSYGKGPGLGYHTGDYKLQAFTSHNLGLGLTCFLRTFAGHNPNLDFLQNSSVAIMYFHYFNDAGSLEPADAMLERTGAVHPDFTANVTEMRLKFGF